MRECSNLVNGVYKTASGEDCSKEECKSPIHRPRIVIESRVSSNNINIIEGRSARGMCDREALGLGAALHVRAE